MTLTAVQNPKQISVGRVRGNMLNDRALVG